MSQAGMEQPPAAATASHDSPASAMSSASSRAIPAMRVKTLANIELSTPGQPHHCIQDPHKEPHVDQCWDDARSAPCIP